MGFTSMTLARCVFAVVVLGMLHLLAAPGSQAMYAYSKNSEFPGAQYTLDGFMHQQWMRDGQAARLARGEITVTDISNWEMSEMRKKQRMFWQQQHEQQMQQLQQLQKQFAGGHLVLSHQDVYRGNGKSTQVSDDDQSDRRSKRLGSAAKSSRAWSKKGVVLLAFALLLAIGLTVFLVLSLTSQL